MGDTSVVEPRWRDVKVGRFVLFSGSSPFDGRIAAIVEVHDSHRVIVENPSDSPDKAVPRHSAPLKHLALTSLEIEKLPRGIGHVALKKKWDDAGIDKKWEAGEFSKGRDKSSKRRKLNDFERFKSMRLRKQRSFQVKKLVAKSKA